MLLGNHAIMLPGKADMSINKKRNIAEIAGKCGSLCSVRDGAVPLRDGELAMW